MWILFGWIDISDAGGDVVVWILVAVWLIDIPDAGRDVWRLVAVWLIDIPDAGRMWCGY